MPAPPVIPEIAEAERLVTRPLRAHRGWVVRERRNGAWTDHPQVRWRDALAAVRKLRAETAVQLAVEARKLEDFGDAVLWAGEMAERGGTSWRKAAQRVISSLPPVES